MQVAAGKTEAQDSERSLTARRHGCHVGSARGLTPAHTPLRTPAWGLSLGRILVAGRRQPVSPCPPAGHTARSLAPTEAPDRQLLPSSFSTAAGTSLPSLGGARHRPVTGMWPSRKDAVCPPQSCCLQTKRLAAGWARPAAGRGPPGGRVRGSASHGGRVDTGGENARASLLSLAARHHADTVGTSGLETALRPSLPAAGPESRPHPGNSFSGGATVSGRSPGRPLGGARGLRCRLARNSVPARRARELPGAAGAAALPARPLRVASSRAVCAQELPTSRCGASSELPSRGRSDAGCCVTAPSAPSGSSGSLAPSWTLLAATFLWVPFYSLRKFWGFCFRILVFLFPELFTWRKFYPGFY